MVLWDFTTSSSSPIEQQVIYLAVNYENKCSYCMSAHSGLAKIVGMLVADVEALRRGEPLADPKLQALRQLTQQMVQARGWVEDAEIEAFLTASYSKQQVLEVSR